MTLTVYQIKQLAEFAGWIVQPESRFDSEDNETEITIEPCPEQGVKDDDGKILRPKHIAYFEEYPDEGVYPLNVAKEQEKGR